MCNGGRLVADIVAGTSTRPEAPEKVQEHLTVTADGLWVVWAYKLARQRGDLFVPMRGGTGYPADARAECRSRRAESVHPAPDPGCTCGFHALSDGRLSRLTRTGFTELTVALSGRVLAFEWPGDGVLWKAERQTVVAVGRSAVLDWLDAFPASPHQPDDPDGRLAARPAQTPHDSGPVRLSLPAACPVVPMSHDDAGWCAQPRAPKRAPASLVLV